VATILDVVDNFFGSGVDISRVPGKAIVEFGEEVQRFADAYDPEPTEGDLDCVYLGGWPSANIWLAETGSLTMTSLLYAERAIGCDPISDWFAPERQTLPAFMPSRPGFRDGDGRALIAESRRYLSIAVPGLQALRPLIETNVVALVPFRRFLGGAQERVAALSDAIESSVMTSPLEFTQRFSPTDLALDDNLRGAFVFAGGEREVQIRRKVRQAIEFFASEYLFAVEHGATYTAPFEFERHLVETGVGGVCETTGTRVMSALLRTRFPLFGSLTPGVIASVRSDDRLGELRGAIYGLYSAIPSAWSAEQTDASIAEAEQALLGPIIARLEVDAGKGPLQKVLNVLPGAAFRMGVGLAIGSAIAPGPLLPALIAGASTDAAVGGADKVRNRPRRRTVWKTLFDHSRSVEHEVRNSTPEPGSTGDWWGIPVKPSMSVTVTAGRLIADYLPTGDRRAAARRRNEICSCGSGLKYKRCCLDAG
jgi:hypothetical protein